MIYILFLNPGVKVHYLIFKQGLYTTLNKASLQSMSSSILLEEVENPYLNLYVYILIKNKQNKNHPD